MRKIKSDPITAADLKEFVINDSDFKFEMSTLSELSKLAFECSYSATYLDPIKEKLRQFDLRAIRRTGEHLLALAVECKNLKPNNPLLISAVPRTANESYYDIIKHTTTVSHYVEAEHRLKQNVYRPGQMVGKKTDQVMRRESRETTIGSDLISDDNETFDKISQAINSSHDLIAAEANNTTPPPVRVIVPVLVVPDNLLWQVEYDSEGNLTKLPHSVQNTSLFIDHAWTVKSLYNSQIQYRISHLEILTLGFLKRAAGIWMGPAGFFSGLA
jgi:hypothetical protein